MKVNMKFFNCILSLTLGSLAMQTHAQKLGFVNGAETVADGSTVVCEALDNPFSGKMCSSGALALQNYSTADIECTVTLSLQDNTLNTTNAAEICMGGSCVPVRTWPFSRTFTAGAGKAVLAQYEAAAKQYGVMNSTLTVTGAGETHTVKLKFVYSDPSGIEAVMASGTSYDVFSLTGKCVARSVFTDNISSLSKGVYLLRDTKTTKTTKIVLR